jgi:hypothetical protein
MTIADQFVLALTCWRENRGGGIPGMQSVANVIMNRAAKRTIGAVVGKVACVEYRHGPNTFRRTSDLLVSSIIPSRLLDATSLQFLREWKTL